LVIPYKKFLNPKDISILSFHSKLHIGCKEMKVIK